jgi:hypothetical protein
MDHQRATVLLPYLSLDNLGAGHEQKKITPLRFRLPGDELVAVIETPLLEIRPDVISAIGTNNADCRHQPLTRFNLGLDFFAPADALRVAEAKIPRARSIE